MLPSYISRRHRSSHERGYVLMAILLTLTLLVIALTAAAPRIAQEIRREREEETIRRGTQYARAIKRYYKAFGRYPTRIEDLENTNNRRFLRKRYIDPMTGKDDWKLLHVGEVTVQPQTFGQPAASPGGVGASGSSGLGTPVSSMASGLSSGPTSTVASPAGGTSTQGATNQPGQLGTPASQLTSGPVLGSGGGIVGVSSASEKESIKELNGKNHYNEWQFFYDPRLDPTAQQVGQAGVNPGISPLSNSPGPNTPQQNPAGGAGPFTPGVRPPSNPK